MKRRGIGGGGEIMNRAAKRIFTLFRKEREGGKDGDKEGRYNINFFFFLEVSNNNYFLLSSQKKEKSERKKM